MAVDAARAAGHLLKRELLGPRRIAYKDSPTNLVLTAVCCAGDGNVYATGRRGLLLKGRKNTWEVVKHDSTKLDLWGMAWYGQRQCL